jgi:long-subunit fatty acid transport protein
MQPLVSSLSAVHQVGDQTRLYYYAARSTYHQDVYFKVERSYSSGVVSRVIDRRDSIVEKLRGMFRDSLALVFWKAKWTGLL